MPHEKRKNIILTADDFGKSELANKNILKLAEAGKLDRVSVMAEGDFAPGEVEELKNTGVKLDIHFELLWQKKRRGILKDSAAKQSLLFLVNHFLGNGKEGAKKEWTGQIEKFRELFGKPPDGINSHEYAHLFPAYFKVATKLAGQFKIPYIRFGTKGLLGKKNAKQTILGNLRRANKKRFSASGLGSSDYFTSLDWITNLDEFFKKNPEGSIEIACHPEREDEFEIIAKYF